MTLAATPAFANGTKLGQVGTDALGGAILPVASMHDMEGGRWIFSVAPGYWTNTDITSDGDNCPNGSCGATTNGGQQNFPFTISGLSIAASLKREFTPHWGLGGIFAYARQISPVSLGNYTSGWQPSNVSGVGSPGGEFENGDSGAGALLATYDPFADPQGFRMPISLGPFYGWQGIDFKHDVSPTQTESVDWSRSYAGVMGNISLDFILFHDLRVMPGIIIFQGFKGQQSDYTYVVNTNGAVADYPGTLTASPSGGEPYVQLLWRPWNLASSISLLSGVDVYALTWSHKWSVAGAKAMIAQAREEAKKQSKAPTLTSQAFQAEAKGIGFDPYIELDPATIALGGLPANSGGTTESLGPDGNGFGARLGLLYWMTHRLALGVAGGYLMQPITNNSSNQDGSGGGESRWYRGLAEAKYLLPINNSVAFSLGAGAGLAKGRADSSEVSSWTGPTWELTPSVLYKNGEFGVHVMGLPGFGPTSCSGGSCPSIPFNFPSSTMLQAFLAYHF